MSSLMVQGKKINISNPEKLLWSNISITKADYIKILIEIAPYLIPYTKDKALTILRYPDGVDKKFFYQKKPPKNTPEWVDTIILEKDVFINLNSLPTLVWLGNMAAIEFHTPFHKYSEEKLTALVFDLDPAEGQTFNHAVECALKIYQTLTTLGVTCYVKTSGATGLQIFIPTRKYTFEQGKKINTFFAKYFVEKFPSLMTIERLIKNREGKLYFDYLQMSKGKNIISVYSPRAVPCGAVSMPVTWEELEKGITPCDFNITNAANRLNNKGDLFIEMSNDNNKIIDQIIQTISITNL